MIKKAQMAKEITIIAPNRAGLLAHISRVLADHGVNIEGIAGYAVDGDAKIMVVTDDDTRAMDALKKEKISSVAVRDVVLVELINKVGALKGLTADLATEDISLTYAYGTTCSGGCPARLILSAKNNEKLLKALKS